MMMTDARGKLGGQVFSKNRSGAIVRTKVSPVNPQSVSQSRVRNIFGSLSSAWRNLAEVDRLAWIAQATTTVKTNIFGDNYNTTGKNLFVSLNSNLGTCGLPAILTPAEPQPTGYVDQLEGVYDIAGEEFSITRVLNDVPAGSYLVFEATAPSSAGIYNFKGKYKVFLVVLASATVTPELYYNAYNEKFGNPAEGQKIGFRVKIVTPAGNASTYASATTLAVG